MGRDTNKRHHPSKDSTPLNLESESLSESNSTYPFLRTEDVTTWSEPKTTASTNLEDDSKNKSDQSTLPGVARSFLAGDLTIHPKNLLVFILGCYIVFVCWLYLQDNSLGKVDQIEGIKNFGLKLIPITALLLLIVLGIFIIIILSNRSKKKSK